MINLKLHVHKEKFDLKDEIARKFKKPIIFYLGHKDDERRFFITFVIMDFEKKEYSYLTSYNEENKQIIEQRPDKDLYWCKDSLTPHGIVVLDPKTKKEFFCFIDEGRYFYHIDIEKKIMSVLIGKDLNCKENDDIYGFGATFYKDEDDTNYFYFSASLKNKEGKTKIAYYKSTLDMKNIKKIHEVKDVFYAPHVTRKYKGYLLNSRFKNNSFKFVNTDKIVNNKFELYDYAITEMFKMYYNKKGEEFTKKNMNNHVSYDGNRFLLDQKFVDFLKSEFGNKVFRQTCESIESCKFTNLPGAITVLDLKTGLEEEYKSAVANPAHFEIDEKNDDIYVSSHNFVILDRFYYMGPAAIDKFHLEKNGKLTKTGTFKHPEGYRFTTHKLFRYGGKLYIATFDQPNRLFIIDAEKMFLLHHEGIGRIYLFFQYLLNFINHSNLEFARIRAIEVSEDGGCLLFLGYKDIYFYDFPRRKIIEKIPYLSSTLLYDDVKLNQFYQRTSHSQYFE